MQASEHSPHNSYDSKIIINNTIVTPEQLREIERDLGQELDPGEYIIDDQGCWKELKSSTRGCRDKKENESNIHNSNLS
ncbi:MAG: hypothetical protein AAGA18_15775 [Verrucomicrobiota bacterium]